MDVSQSWIPLKVLQEHNPIEVAEFAIATEIDHEPAFAYWVKHTIRQQNRMISSASARVRKSSHKYGIEVPTSIGHALRIDKENKNTLWMDALLLEMETINVAFDFQQEGASAPRGYSKTSGHIIWDVKMDFTRKARWVKNGHLTRDPETSNFAGVVS